MMIQACLLVVALAAGAVVVGMDMSGLQSPVSLSVPGMPSVPLTKLQVVAGMGGVLVLLWLAGVVDLAILRGHIRRRDGLLEAKDQEILRIKAEAYDQQQPALANISTRLDKVAEEVRIMTVRLDPVAPRRQERAIDQAGSAKPEPSLVRG